MLGYFVGKGLVFDKVYKVILGGRVDNKGVQSQNFYGILGGRFNCCLYHLNITKRQYLQLHKKVS